MRTIIAILSTVCILLFVGLPISTDVQAQSPRVLLVVANAGVKISNISFADLRKAFLGEPVEYESGKRLVPFNLSPGTRERDLFDQKVLGLAPGEVGRFWINRRIRDEGAPPRVLQSPDLVLRVVASLPSAISYVAATPNQVAVPGPGLRVLSVDGKSSVDGGYLLRF